ncbi:MAG: SHOCT domain-containing protein [Solirubrobacterales bacterium]|nr:SHOCT domain-containing protein [Solirubrobacterales bacterium]
MPIAEFTLGHALLTVLSIFFFVIWIWILIVILSDLFRDSELSGWWKAVWVLFLVFIPFLTALIYLIARGNGMRERTIQAQADAKKEFDEYVRSTAGGTSTADELGKLADLKAKGVLSEEEYQAQKAKLIG